MKQKKKNRNYIFTVSLCYTTNKTTPLFEGTIWAEVRIWRNTWQLKDKSYSGSALQHVSDTYDVPQLIGMPHTGQQHRGPRFLLRPCCHRRSVVNLSCLYYIDQTSFFWNVSSSIRVHSLSVPTVVFHILLLKTGRVNQFNLKVINILSTCREVYCLSIQWHSGNSVLKLVYWLAADISFKL